MKQPSQAVFDEWERALKSDNIPRIMTEVRDQSRIAEITNSILTSLREPLERVHGQSTPKVSVGGLALWDFAALVGKDKDDGYCIGIGIGSVRLLDVFSACLCVFLFEKSKQAQDKAQRILGAVLYDYARRKTHRLRHWVMDPTLGLAIPYGFVDTRFASIVPQGAEEAHWFYLTTMLSWTIAHEVAHIAAGDVNEPKSVVVMAMSGKPITLTTKMPQPEKELNADIQALRTLVEQHPDAKRPMFSALTYFLGLLEIVERISTQPVFSGSSHPTPINRLDNLINSLTMALPGTAPSEIERLRSIGLDFRRFSAGIAKRILDAPEEFRIYPFILEDYQEEPPGNDILDRAAEINNNGDLRLAKRDLQGALQLYMQAEKLLRGADYGEGHRIVWINLIRTTAALGRYSESLKWLEEGIRIAKQNYDKPVMIKLLREYRHALGDIHQSPRSDLVDEVHKLLNPVDEDLEAALSLSETPKNSALHKFLNWFRKQ